MQRVVEEMINQVVNLSVLDAQGEVVEGRPPAALDPEQAGVGRGCFVDARRAVKVALLKTPEDYSSAVMVST